MPCEGDKPFLLRPIPCTAQGSVILLDFFHTFIVSVAVIDVRRIRKKLKTEQSRLLPSEFFDEMKLFLRMILRVLTSDDFSGADVRKIFQNIPNTILTGTGNLAAMSAFSRSAQNAMSTLRSQYLAGEKARVEITEDANKVTQLANKLEWARLVEEMSDSSKVLVIKEPRPLRDWEYASPKLFTNILLGIVFGTIFSLMVLIYSEKTDKKLSYSMLGDNIIYDLDKEFNTLSAEIMSNINEKKAFIFFEDVSNSIAERLKQFTNTIFIKADISNEFTNTLNSADSVVLFASIGKTDFEKSKLVKKMISNLDKKILYEVLI